MVDGRTCSRQPQSSRNAAVKSQKKGRSQRSGQVQGGNAQEGQRQAIEDRDAALQQYAWMTVAPQVKKLENANIFQ
jgi:hypothetical protein